MTRVSVIAPCWRHGKHIEECLGSVLFGQRYRDFELIVVQDGMECQDVEATNWLAGYRKHPQLRTIQHLTNRGQAAAINTGMAAAEGTDYLTWIHVDNHFAPHWLQLLVGELDEHRDADFAWSHCVKERGDHVDGRWVVESRQTMREQSQSFLFRRSLWQKTGEQRGDYAHDSDWFWRAEEAGKFIELPAVLMQRRIHPGGVSQTQRHRDDSAHWMAERKKRRGE